MRTKNTDGSADVFLWSLAIVSVNNSHEKVKLTILFHSPSQPEKRTKGEGACTTNPSQIFVHNHFYYDLIEFKM